MVRTLLATAVLAVTLACPAAGHAASPLVGTSWKFERIAGRAVDPGYTASLSFGRNGHFSGRHACNHIGGDYRVRRARLSFPRLLSTLVGCERESSRHNVSWALAGTRLHRRTTRRLVLLGARGRVLARLRRTR